MKGDMGNVGKMKRPMTTAELFHTICEILTEKGMMPEILDYAMAERFAMAVTTYAFSFHNHLDYGGNEGIYLDIWIEAPKEKKGKFKYRLGTFKTLDTGREAMRIMGCLLADFIAEGTAYVNEHLDDFTWEGFDVYPMDDAGKRLPWGFSCASYEGALKRKEELLKQYPKVILRENASRRERVMMQ